MLITIRPGSPAEALVVRRQAAIAASKSVPVCVRQGRELTKDMPIPVRRPLILRRAQHAA
jgi:hypothetical protein